MTYFVHKFQRWQGNNDANGPSTQCDVMTSESLPTDKRCFLTNHGDFRCDVMTYWQSCQRCQRIKYHARAVILIRVWQPFQRTIHARAATWVVFSARRFCSKVGNWANANANAPGAMREQVDVMKSFFLPSCHTMLKLPTIQSYEYVLTVTWDMAACQLTNVAIQWPTMRESRWSHSNSRSSLECAWSRRVFAQLQKTHLRHAQKKSKFVRFKKKIWIRTRQCSSRIRTFAILWNLSFIA